jgi:Rrf2 family cysteine metabolism transcriptional repressor
MWISTKAQYGLRALVDIARQPGEVVPLKDVSARQGISQAYLEQIASNLRRSGFIRSVRGASGGYKLARIPEQINAYDVVVALEGSIAPVECVEHDHSCDRSGLCSTEGLWRRVDSALRQVLGASTLADLIREQEELHSPQLLQLEEVPAHGLTTASGVRL